MRNDDIYPYGDEPVDKEERFQVRKPGVTLNQMKQLKQCKNFFTVDLHGLLYNEALETLLSALDNQQIYLKFIHGKGIHSSSNKPVLKNMVYLELKKNPLVIAFCSARDNDGGSGATYALLKKRSHS